ncbi:hypothetical protein F0562_001516 [Nyssa sinensis]|uniref:Uncharacterized protein n=1 Tax=Nyssa sinensis TaxID=561372 RepID=A0A5J5C7D9_9ASTE|nr:hypothetical protein F0562_001516 [Nyssa sinensis]
MDSRSISLPSIVPLVITVLRRPISDGFGGQWSKMGSDPAPSVSPTVEQSLNRWPLAPSTVVAEKDRNDSAVAEEKKGGDVMVSSYWGICPRGKVGRFLEQMV